MAISAKEMGFKVGVLDPVSDCPAAQVADWHIESVYDDTFALKERLMVFPKLFLNHQKKQLTDPF